MTGPQKEIKDLLGKEFDKIAYISYVKRALNNSREVTDHIFSIMIGIPVKEVERIMLAVEIYDKYFSETEEYWRAWVK